MKRKHIFLIIGLVIVIVIGFVVYRVIGSLDEIIEAGIENYGSKITQADVSLDKVTLDLANGKAALHGLTVGNPQGFNTEYLMKLDEISMTLDTGTITRNPVVIKEIMIQGPSVIYEMASGGSNVDTLLKNVKSYTGSSESKSEGGGQEHKLIIDDLYIRDGQVNLSAKALQGKKMTTGLPDIHMQDIGRDEGGATPGEVTEQIMAQIKSGASTAIGSMKNLPGAISDQLGGAGGTLKDKLNEAGEKLKGLFGK